MPTQWPHPTSSLSTVILSAFTLTSAWATKRSLMRWTSFPTGSAVVFLLPSRLQTQYHYIPLCICCKSWAHRWRVFTGKGRVVERVGNTVVSPLCSSLAQLWTHPQARMTLALLHCPATLLVVCLLDLVLVALSPRIIYECYSCSNSVTVPLCESLLVRSCLYVASIRPPPAAP